MLCFYQVWCGAGTQACYIQGLAGAVVCVLWSKKLAEDGDLAEEKRGRVQIDDKEKDHVARYVEEGGDKDFWQVCKEGGRGRR